MAEKSIQVIDRAFDILETLATEKDGLGVTEIGNRIGLHKSTVHRILSALAERGYVERTSAKGAYRIGLKLVDISSIYLNSVELKTESRPYLRDLTSRLHMPSHLAIMDGKDAVYIDKVDVESSIRLYSQIGRRIPLHCSALGKSLLAGLQDHEISKLLQDYEFKSYTAKTILNSNALLEQIREVKIKGWSADDEEHDEGIRCIASPIRDYRGVIIASVSIAGPSQTLSAERDAEIGIEIRETARKISERMGYRG